MSKKSQKKSNTVTRAAFERAVSDIYKAREELAEVLDATVSREAFVRAINDCRRLRAERDAAYAAGASQVLNSDYVTTWVPHDVRRNLRPSRFAKKAARATRGA